MPEPRHTSGDGPLVSVVVPAFNLARYLPAALDSALTQIDPGGAVEVIVVDDGSTDDTPEVIARYGERIRAIRQPNGGLTAAASRGFAEARGEFVALLDADDEWPRDRLARHVRILRERPVLGLVHGDMQVTDAHGTVIAPSFMAQYPEPPVNGRALGHLIRRNFVSGGATTFRASLLPALMPMGPETAYPDWRISACVAAVAEIHHDPACANRYRSHCANMSLNRGLAHELTMQRGELPWRRWMMTHLATDDAVTPHDRLAMVRAWRSAFTAAALGAEEPAHAILTAAPRPAPAVDGAPPSHALLRRFAENPLDGGLEVDLEVALLREAQQPTLDPPPPLITMQARERLTLVTLADALAHPVLLDAFAEETSGATDETLVILAPHGADLQSLVELVERSPALSDEECDITVLTAPATTPARALLAAWAHARLGDDPSLAEGGPYAQLPVHGAGERARALH